MVKEQQNTEKPATKQQVMDNVRRWRREHQLERPEHRTRFDNRMMGLDRALKAGAK